MLVRTDLGQARRAVVALTAAAPRSGLTGVLWARELPLQAGPTIVLAARVVGPATATVVAARLVFGQSPQAPLSSLQIDSLPLSASSPADPSGAIELEACGELFLECGGAVGLVVEQSGSWIDEGWSVALTSLTLSRGVV